MRAVSLLLALTAAVSGAAPANSTAGGNARTFVFFAWDRPVIDGDAAAILDKVAESVRGSPVARLELSGHADRSGPEGANRRAGRKRAEAVRAYLAARGVPETAMTIVSHGEAQPLIATADGVREPQNRRVEVVTLRPAAN